MSRSESITPHLPLLRRYARALTGSQESGDAFVIATLEAALADPESLNADKSPRVALYTAFTRILSSASVRGADPDDAETDGERLAQSRLGVVGPEARQALLLTTLEEFTPEQAGIVLGRTPEEVCALVASAMSEITKDIRTDVLIIEDETVIALDLAAIVEDMGHSVSHIAISRSDAVKAARRRQPGLILADIQLADDSSGIDAVKDILADVQVPAIFITAYPERLLTGERPEPTFLITKPFLPDSVRAAIGQALFFQPKARETAAAKG
ncbi:response regulator [Desertibaculum subflavum]|uniref:response regulator n=1 Tax=Desertibaculum subflavum TaxID=2268458 RepID=UPI000E671B1A